MDLLIASATVVLPGSAFTGNIGIKNGKIAQIGGDISASKMIDATGKFVVPGGIDMHVHISKTEPFVDDFYSGTGAGVAGGITTVGVMTEPNAGESLLAVLDRTAQDATSNAVADFTLHPVLRDPSPETLAEFPKLVELGYSSIKIFMMDSPFDERAADYAIAIEAAGRNGILPMIHCEDAGVVGSCERNLKIAGKIEPRYFPESRPPHAEALATARAIALAETTRTPIYIVHVSSGAALTECSRGRAKGLPVFVETRPIYLHLSRERYMEPDGAKYGSWPPLRERTDMERLWAGLRFGEVDTIASDHAPWMLAQKFDQGSRKVGIPYVPGMPVLPGMSNIETMLPLLYSEGVLKHRLSLNRFVELTSTNPAKLFGMFPQKGTISLGSDADLVVWDPDETRTIRAKEMHSRADFDVFEGWEVKGWPAYTISRGELVYENHQITGRRGRGRIAKRGPHQPL